jgi:hypothetical protein
MGVAAGIAGAALMIGGSAMSAGKRTRIPDFPTVDIEGEQQKAIKQNIASIESSEKLSEKTAAAEQSILERQLERAIPGYKSLIQQVSKNISSSLSGLVSPEISRLVQQSTAGKALARGFGAATGAGRALTARDLGMTGMQLQQQGLSQAMQFIGSQRSTGMAQPMSVSSMFISPSMRINLRAQENVAKFNRDVRAAEIAAQPDPMMAAIGGSFSNIGGILLGGAVGGSFSGKDGKGDGGGIYIAPYQPSYNVYSQPPYYSSGQFGYSMSSPPPAYSGGFGY